MDELEQVYNTFIPTLSEEDLNKVFELTATPQIISPTYIFTMQSTNKWVAIDYINSVGYDKIQEHDKEIVEYAREKLGKLDYLDLYMTPNEKNHSSVISFNIKGVHPHDVASILDSEGVCVRSRKSLRTATFKVNGD